MKKGLFVYPRYTAGRKDNAFGWLKEEAALCGFTLEICFEEDCHIEYSAEGASISFAGVQMDDVSFVVMRTYNENISRYYESKGNVLVVNDSHSMRTSKNKLLTHQALSAEGIHTPHTIYDPYAEYSEIARVFGDERFIVKRIDGSKGEDVFLIDDKDSFDAAAQKMRPDCIYQKFIDDSYGRDIRIWVIGDECVGAVIRYSETSFLSNYSQGGKFKATEPDDAAKELALKATKAVNLMFAGVDLLYHGDSYSVCEVNGNAGFRTISFASDVNIPRSLFRFISRVI